MISDINNKQEVLAKANTNENTECIGFVELITKNPEISAPKLNV